jgi:CRISPR/Cas system CSM-associated protein Csm2 small subunit
MKKLIILSFALLSVGTTFAQQLHSKVEERFELTSIMFAIAGAQEYSQCAIPSYKEDIAALTERFAASEPIDYVRELRQYGIGYDAVSTVADMMEIKNGKVRLQSRYDIAKISERDSRWNEVLLAKYLEMVNLFYKQSRFDRFFEDHAGLYRLAEERMDRMLAGVKTDWFESFYGRPLDPSLRVYISLNNGPSNYATPSGVLIGTAVDEAGQPAFNPVGATMLIIHEFGHHYVNSMIDTRWPQMEAVANKIFSHVQQQMARNAYGTAKITMVEWLNNLFMLMYFKEHTPQYVDYFTRDFVNRGWVWMDRSVALTEEFYADRERYPHIEDFMPRLVEHLDEVAENIGSMIAEREALLPRVVDVSPARGSDITGVTEIVITFSEPMHRMHGFTQADDQEVKQMDFVTGAEWSTDGLRLTFRLDPTKAAEESVYGFKFMYEGFASVANNLPLRGDTEDLIFKTAKK